MLVLATAADAELAGVLRADAAITLAPLDVLGVAAVASRYAAAGLEVPVARVAEETGGLPKLVHQAADEWTRAQAERRLGDAAGHAATERVGRRAAEDDLAGERRGGAERARARRRQHASERWLGCPFKGLASFDVEDAAVFFGRERLVADMVARCRAHA